MIGLGAEFIFWEYNLERAHQWALDQAKKDKSSVKEPAVLGAIIDLGYCLDLTDSMCVEELSEAYVGLKKVCRDRGLRLPTNSPAGKPDELLIRKLDCAVIQFAEEANYKAQHTRYDSVRAAFWEGEELYPNAGFRKKNHIQICICNPNCIKGYFLPQSVDDKYPNP